METTSAINGFTEQPDVAVRGALEVDHAANAGLPK